MGYYDIKLLAVSDKLSKLRKPVVNLKNGKRKILIDFSSSKYEVVLADQIKLDHKLFEDNCRRHLYGISTIKLGYKEYTELHMIRTEMKVLILRVLQEHAYAHSLSEFWVDRHMVEKIDLKKFADMHKVDLTGSLESDRLDRYITNLLEGLREEMGVMEKSDCECYLIENREYILHHEAIIEKFYFFHNASERRIVYVVYRILSESEDA
ncbi:hypothetical protein R3W88_013207 [Solanum pinnatisectum]|uniref:Uncharacterized protein n=1 Tax=Solanum pinnatisectum TaxID=50273 RepID=A0AAV9LDY2_9SOLN|nr:hypothetical protein R3W88_013207 [Solanum pinnatisectum]